MNRLLHQLLLIALILMFLPAALTAQNAPPIVHEQTARPPSARATGLVSVSTAESGGLHDHAPLHNLPSFQVTKLDGSGSDISFFQQTKHWLLLYRRENCAPCDRMLKTFAESDNALLKSGTQLIVVVADSGKTNNGNRLDATRARFTAITGATWLEDTNGAALKALRPHGTPVLYALSGNRIQWSQPGLPPDPTTLNRMAASWIGSEDPLPSNPANATSDNAAAAAPSINPPANTKPKS